MSKGILDKQKSDVEIVRSSWEQLKAEIKPDRAMTSFLYETLDKGGADICLAAFELVHRVLHPEGYVRRAHKSENQNLKAFVQDEDGPWRQKNLFLESQYDFQDSWKTNMQYVKSMNGKKNDWTVLGAPAKPLRHDRPHWRKYVSFDKNAVGKYCKKIAD